MRSCCSPCSTKKVDFPMVWALGPRAKGPWAQLAIRCQAPFGNLHSHLLCFCSIINCSFCLLIHCLFAVAFTVLFVVSSIVLFAVSFIALFAVSFIVIFVVSLLVLYRVQPNKKLCSRPSWLFVKAL